MSGVSCVLLWNSADGKVGPQSLENLMKKIELLGAVRIGRMHIESAIYFASQSKSTCKNFQVLTSSEYPASCFVFTDSNTMLVGDLAFREFAGYLKSAFQRKRKLQVEGKGIKYKLGDFGLNFVTLFMGQSANVKGYLIEVTFGASCMIHLCGDILRAFITQVLPGVCPPVGDPSMAENIFSHSFHKAVQTGSVDSPRWPPVHLAVGGLQTTAFDQLLSHACARLTMTQYAEHMNTVRRLSRQVSQPVSSASSSISAT